MKFFIDKEFEELLKLGKIDSSLYEKYDVKRGLRNSNGTGVLIGLTKVSDVSGYNLINGNKVPKEGNLYYRDYDLYELAKKDNDVFGFERIVFLLLFAHLPSDEELCDFKEYIKNNYQLPNLFVENVIMNNPSKNLMNNIQKSILSLYSYDDDPDSQDLKKMIEKGLSLLAKMPSIIAYSYQAKKHYIDNESLHVHYVNKDLSIAQLILSLIRDDSKFSEEEAELLDTALIVHADHGGGNNSTFSTEVVSSTGTDIYSSITAGLCSLKGPRHGGASLKVIEMMNYIISKIGLDASDEDILNIVKAILNKEEFDKSGLIYGLGHAVYTLSDPRCVLLKKQCQSLANKKDPRKFNFFARFESIALAHLEKVKGKVYCANVDFYSGLTYEYLNIPLELYTPLFSTARIAGWIAHIIENNLYSNKIIRPASKYVGNVEE